MFYNGKTWIKYKQQRHAIKKERVYEKTSYINFCGFYGSRH